MEAFFQLSRLLWKWIFCTYLVYYWDTVIKNIFLVLRLYTHCDHFRRWSRVVNVTSLYTLALLFQNYLSGITGFICIMTLQGSFGFQYRTLLWILSNSTEWQWLFALQVVVQLMSSWTFFVRKKSSSANRSDCNVILKILRKIETCAFEQRKDLP